MKTIDLAQGSSDWLAFRATRFWASEAPAMMGSSSHLSRAELVRIRAIGNEQEFSDYVRKHVLDRGHEIQDAAQPMVEDEIGEALYPVVAVSDDDQFGASPDGLTMDELTGWECKSRNADLWAMAQRGEITEEHRCQMDHQMLVCGCERIMFTVSDGTPAGTITLEYSRDEDRIDALRAGWAQFAADVAAYQHVEVLPAPAPEVQEALPELSLVLVGEVRSSNLATWSQSVAARIKAIPVELKTDQDFATAERTVRFLEDGEEKLAFVKRQALAQTETIDALFKTVDKLSEQMRQKRLALSKLVAARKETIRAEIVQSAKDAFANHVVLLNDRLGADYMPMVPVDFAGSVKGKKTVKSLHDAVAGELSRAKLAANEIADRIQVNIRAINKIASGEKHQFPDMRAIVLKAPEDCVAFVKNRIAENKAVAEKKEAEQRERIEAELRAKMATEEAARIAAQAATDKAAAIDLSMAQPAPISGLEVAVQSWAPTDQAMMFAATEAVGKALGSIGNPRKFLQGLLANGSEFEIIQLDARTYRLSVL